MIKQKQVEDAPIGYYKELPVTKGKGRFGPFVKWNGMFVETNFQQIEHTGELREDQRFMIKDDIF